MENSIELFEVSKEYTTTQPIHALKKITLQIRAGDSVCIIGPSGSGKSTLLQLIGGLDVPSEGRVIVNGVNIASMNDRELSSFRNDSIGFIFQFFNLMDYMNVTDNVVLPLIIAGEDTDQSREKAATMLQKVNLQHRAVQWPNQLSGGEMQRVAIARALTNNPKIILADEPTGNLDKENALLVMQTLSELAQDGTTVIMVTHDPRAIPFFRTVIEMENGNIKKITHKK